MTRILKRQFVTASVYDKALERINSLFDRFDKVVVSFSGGKDSTVCLNLALMVAAERGRLPLDVYTFDEEAIHPETVQYLARGTHAVLRMAAIVRSMVEAGLGEAEICKRLGMEAEELERLLDRSGMTVRGSAGAHGFGRAWVPGREG